MISAATTPTAVAGPILKPSADLDDLTAGRDLQARDVDRANELQERLAGGGRQLVGRLVVVDRRERRHPVQRDLGGSTEAVRTDDAGDVRKSRHVGEERDDRSPYSRRINRAVRDMEDDRVGVTTLSGELVREQIMSPLRLRAREAEDADVVRPDDACDDRYENGHADPRDDNRTTVSHAPASERTHPYPQTSTAAVASGARQPWLRNEPRPTPGGAGMVRDEPCSEVRTSPIECRPDRASG